MRSSVMSDGDTSPESEWARLAVIVPCFNEGDNLGRLVDRFRESISDEPGVQLVIVNNGSTDDSATILSALERDPRNGFLCVVTVKHNRGYGHGIVTGLRWARSEFLAWTHADLQTDPADVMAGYHLITSSADPRHTLVRGRRVKRPLFDSLFTAGMSLVASVLLHARLRDINAQPKVFHRSLLDSMRDAPHDFSFDVYVLLLARRLRLSVLEFPVAFHSRMHGRSKGGGSLIGKLRLSARTLAYLITMRSREDLR